MNAESKFSRLLLVSPWSLLVFIAIPLLVILSFTLHIRIPLMGSTTPLLVNNICFALITACRLLWYCAGIKRAIRYGSCCYRPRQAVTLSIPVTEARRVLNSAGYAFAADGGYGEKRDIGYIGTTVMYGGLLILLSTGSWDNLRQFSGVLLDGMGPATNLSKMESYRSINKGPFARTASLPQMHIISQTLPDSTYPKGATQVVLTAEDGKEQNVTLVPGKPVRYGAFDISMTKLVFQPQIVIKDKSLVTPLFDELVTLNPLVQKRGAYSFYGLFQGVVVGGGVYYHPEKNMLMVVITRGGEKVVTDLAFQVDQQVVKGDYILSCSKMGQWSEIHVIHRRHKGLLVVGAFIAFIGLLLRAAIGPQRVWLEEASEGCVVRAVGKEAIRLVKPSIQI